MADTSFSAEQHTVEHTVFPILFAISFSHLLNDTMQSLIPAVYPLVKHSLHLNFTEVGLITLVFQLTASLLQPAVGFFSDKKPQPYSLAIGMCSTLAGLSLLAFVPSYALVLCAVALVGMGSAVFHPEASRVAFMASGGRRGMAQSLFQVGGNAGSSLGPLLAALLIAPYGRGNILWFSLAAFLGIAVLVKVGAWYSNNMHRIRSKGKAREGGALPQLSRRRVAFTIGLLLVLIFSKYFYMASMTSYFTFYLIAKFHMSVQAAQVHLFIFLFAIAAGTFLGGPLGDRFGRKYVIWFSILGAAPFTLLLPHANLLWTTVLSVCIGVILSSAFAAILVYAQELLPGKVGLVAGLFFGFAFGLGGVGSAVLGKLADSTSIAYVYRVCSFLPLIGIVAVFLPNIEGRAQVGKVSADLRR